MSAQAQLEERLLGAVLDAEAIGSNAGALLDAAGLVSADFVSARVCTAWRLATSRSAANRLVTAETLFAAGASARLLSDADRPWLMGLQAGNTLSREEFQDVADNVRRMARANALASTLAAQLEALRSGTSDVGTVATALAAACEEVSGIHTADDTGDADVLELAQEAEAREAGEAPNLIVPTGIAALDEMTGGLVPNLVIIAGAPSAGKSAFMATIIERQLLLGLKVGLFGLEDGTRWLAKRLMARDLGVKIRDIGTKKPSDFGPRWGEVGQHYTTLLKSLTVYRRDTITTDEMIRRATHWVKNRGVQCIFVDHVGEVEHSTRSESDERKHHLAFAETVRRMRNFAVRYQVPVVVLAHTKRIERNNRDAEAPPSMDELAESSAIEKKARLMLGMWERQKDEKKFFRITVMKATEGARDVTLKIARFVEAGLLDPNSGEVVNLWAERMAEAREAKEKRAAESAAKRAADASTKKARSQMALGVDA